MVAKKKKILFLINKMKLGGAERAFVNQINELLKDDGFEICLGVLFQSAAAENYFSELSLPQENIKVFGFQRVLDITAFKKFLSFIKSQNIDTIYSTLESANQVARIAKLFKPSMKIIIRESGMADRKILMNKIFDVVTNFLASSIVAVSDEVKASLLAYQPMHAKKITLIPNGIVLKDWEWVKAKRAEFQRSDITILNVGSMNNDNKGQRGILEAFNSLVNEKGIKNIKLVLIGEGKLRKEYEQYVVDKGLSDKVTFIGHTMPAEIEKYYLGSDIFVLNSKNEGFSNALLEAMSYGVVPVTTKVGGVGSLIKDSVNGYLIDNPHKISAQIIPLLQDKIILLKTGYEARKTIEKNFKIEDTLRLLQSVIN